MKPFSVLTGRNKSHNIFTDDVYMTKSTTELEDTEAPEPGQNSGDQRQRRRGEDEGEDEGEVSKAFRETEKQATA